MMSIVISDTLSVTFPIGSFERFFSADRFRTLRKVLPSQTKPSAAPDVLLGTFMEMIEVTDNEIFVSMFSEVLFEIFGFDVLPEDRIFSGRNYYQFSLKFDGGFVAFGGNNVVFQQDGLPHKRPETFQVYFDAKGCEKYLRSFKSKKHLRDSLICFGGRITRIDPALDFLDGGLTIDDFEAAYLDGRFNGKGRPPKFIRIEEKTLGSRNNGDTAYVGSRQGGKMSRAYEKGKQLGDPCSLWVRVEGECNTNNRRFIDPDCLLDLDSFFAELYPYHSDLLDKIKEDHVQGKACLDYKERKKTITIDALIRHARRGYGKVLYAMNSVLGMDEAQIFKILSVPDLPQRLEAC